MVTYQVLLLISCYLFHLWPPALMFLHRQRRVVEDARMVCHALHCSSVDSYSLLCTELRRRCACLFFVNSSLDRVASSRVPLLCQEAEASSCSQPTLRCWPELFRQPRFLDCHHVHLLLVDGVDDQIHLSSQCSHVHGGNPELVVGASSHSLRISIAGDLSYVLFADATLCGMPSRKNTAQCHAWILQFFTPCCHYLSKTLLVGTPAGRWRKWMFRYEK